MNVLLESYAVNFRSFIATVKYIIIDYATQSQTNHDIYLKSNLCIYFIVMK